MSRKQDVWVSPDGEGEWNAKQGKLLISHHRLQSNAINVGKREAKKDEVDLVIQGRDGRIRSKDSYGNDPNPPKDREN